MRSPMASGKRATDAVRVRTAGQRWKAVRRAIGPFGHASHSERSAWEGEAKRAAAAVGRLNPDAPAVGLDDAAADGQADPYALGLVVRAREHAEDPARVVGLDARSVVTHGHDPSPAVAQRRHLDPWRRLATELQRVRDEVLKHAAQLPGITLDVGQ